MQKISPHHLVFFDEFVRDYPIAVELVYADPAHPDNHFGALYEGGARLLGHRDLACVTLLAAHRLQGAYGWRLVLKDCLRPMEAQALMMETEIVKANPHWLIEPRFLSMPGQGGHPRGMAIDVGALNAAGDDIDFGTRFDYFSSSTDVSVNKAHRNYQGHSESVNQNRKILQDSFEQAGRDLNLPLYPLPHEWWDFRFTSDYTNEFFPLSEADMPDGYKMTIKNKLLAYAAPETLAYIKEKLSRFL